MKTIAEILHRCYRTVPLVLLFALVFCSSSPPRIAPYDGTFFVGGTVTSNGKPVSGVYVVLTFDPPHAVPEIVETDQSGVFKLGSIIGSNTTSYTLTFAKQGLVTISRQASYPATKTINVEMERTSGAG